MTGNLHRRTFLTTAASSIAFAFALEAASAPLANEGSAEARPRPLSVWVTIFPDGTITIVSPAAELGQGTYTTLPAVLAEELDADWAKVKLVQPPGWDEKKHGNPGWNNNFQTTSSLATRGYYKAMRLAGAQARRVLLDAVAERWSVPLAELGTEPSIVVHQKSGRRIGYGDVAAFAKVPDELPRVTDRDLKDPSSFRFIGKDVPRIDVPLKVKGAATYGIDVQVPGMVYAAIVLSPYLGGTPETVDASKAMHVPGVLQMVEIPDGVAVVGTTIEATQTAKKLVDVAWKDAPAARIDSEKLFDEFVEIARDKQREGVPFEPVGDALQAMKSAARVVTGDYRTPYLYHAQMEPMNCTARVSADGKSADIWVGSQAPSFVFADAMRVLQTERKNITFHQQFVGGGYGRRNGYQDSVVPALQIAKAVGKPVKLVWTREDDFLLGRFRPMTAHHIEAGLDKDGKIIAWHHRIVAESPSGFRATMMGGKPPQHDVVVMKGSALPQYNIPNKRAEHIVEARGTRVSPWRGVGVGHNAFAVESVLDDIARMQQKDPIAFRLELSAGIPRVQTLLRAVAEMSDWPRARNGRTLGVAFMEKDDTLAAGVAEISLNRDSGKLRVHRFWAAIDAGLAVQPRNIAAQTEGGIVYALGHVLREHITIKNGRVVQSNFPDYEVTRMSDVPEIEVRVVSTDNPPTGAGEDGVPLVAAAVGNAVATLTGRRLHALPFSPPSIRELLSSGDAKAI